MVDNKPTAQMYEQISEWLDIYHSTSSIVQKNKTKAMIVSFMIPVVSFIARRIARRTTDPIEDLIQAGYIGLLKAIDNYSKEKNDNFKVYAGYLIIGEMKHYLRDQLNTIRVPRHIQELVFRINTFTKKITSEDIEKLTCEEVATVLNIPTEKVDFAMQVERRCSTISLEDVYKADSEFLSFEELIPAYDYKEVMEINDAKIIFNDVLEQLDIEDKFLIDLYYKQGMKQKDIAEALNVTQMSVSRKIKKAFNAISKILGVTINEDELGLDED